MGLEKLDESKVLQSTLTFMSNRPHSKPLANVPKRDNSLLLEALNVGFAACNLTLLSLKRGKQRGYSSVGRAPDLHSGGQEFESPYLHHPFHQEGGQFILGKKSGAMTTQPGLVAQLVRAHD